MYVTTITPKHCEVNPTMHCNPGLQGCSVLYMHVVGQNLKSCYFIFGCLSQYLSELGVGEMVCTLT